MLHHPAQLTRISAYSGVLLAASIVCAAAAPAAAADVTGDWRVKDGTAIIRVANCNGAMWGAVAWEKIPGGRDTNNPDAAKKNRPNLGMPVLLNMKQGDEVGEWEGHVYNAKNGKTYESKIRLAKPDALEIEGCVLGFLCGGETWTRVTSLPPGPAAATAGTAPAKAQPPKAQTKAQVKPGSKTTGSANPPIPDNDPIGDVCLLPDVARGTH